ncbi:MAG: hypothetical protein FJX75_15705 [Armatimonadetes bacterium]|nr:hypothetical protein [Armatimonadota bacterium]
MGKRAASGASAAVEPYPPSAVDELGPEVAVASAELASRLERLQETFASLQIGVVDGYFVKLWTDPDSGEWVAECPTVKTVAQADTREGVLEAITQLTREMLAALADMGVAIPARDLQPQ